MPVAPARSHEDSNLMQQLNFCARPLSLIMALSALAVAQPTIPMNVVPSRALGQLRVTDGAGAPNLLEGREFNQPQDVWLDAPRGFLYVADTRNNRVLAWRNPAGAANGATADLVLG
ncbi:MAG: hypothetical protein K2Q23_08475, partial [Bryobacteraceae bacterium]|nr:hypothetical protein [Bryobacteraceae bacterium]